MTTREKFLLTFVVLLVLIVAVQYWSFQTLANNISNGFIDTDGLPCKIKGRHIQYVLHPMANGYLAECGSCGELIPLRKSWDTDAAYNPITDSIKFVIRNFDGTVAFEGYAIDMPDTIIVHCAGFDAGYIFR